MKYSLYRWLHHNPKIGWMHLLTDPHLLASFSKWTVTKTGWEGLGTVELGSLLYVEGTKMCVKSERDIDAVIYATWIYIDGTRRWLHRRHKAEHQAEWWETTNLFLKTSKTEQVDNHWLQESKREGNTRSSARMERLWKDVVHLQHL